MPIHVAPLRDPRTIITPDAFEVSRELLGLPLAPPFKRLAALLIDLAVIGAITLLTKSFALVLGLVVAVLFIREGFKRTPVKGSVFGRAMRLSVGCLGTWIGIITVIVWISVGVGGTRDSGRDAEPDVETSSEGSSVSSTGLTGLLSLAQGIGEARIIEEADNADEARDAAADLARRAFAAGISEQDLRRILADVIPDDAEWSGESQAIVDQAVAAAHADSTPTREGVEVVRTDTAGGMVVEPLVADTLLKLQGRVAALEASVAERQLSLEQATDALRTEREGGFGLSTLRGFVDELGFGFGWASLYLTVMLSWWRGQTIGKRVMKIRVLRLDGEPITWWAAFERAGGYAAGIATGLLGFAQVFWDSNRQAIHDRIAGTVVVIDGADKVVDWENVL
ncbi:MAG: RDD family protein [Longimicrobiales bacterium]|nr:RDD family protein [Longimicrobiales bacterium]